MRLLVTRPDPDAEQTAARLRTLGHEPIVAPILRAEFLTPARAVEPAAIAFTSRNGVRATALWHAARAWRGLPVFAVGRTTAEAARDAGFRDVRSAAGDGEALAATIIAARDPAGGTILYPAAEDRSPVFERRLAAAGFRVETVIAYRMAAMETLPEVATKALPSGRVEGVLLYSRRSAEVFLTLLDRAGLGRVLPALRLFVLSPAVGEALAGRAVGAIDVAARPDEDALLDLLPAAR